MIKLFTFPAVVCFLGTLTISAQELIELKPIQSGLRKVVDIESAGDERLFIVDVAGIIRIMSKEGEMNEHAFLDIREKVRDNANEQGLLGLVFHPNYAENGYFFVNYTFGDGDTRIARYTRRADNPERADPDSEKVIIEIGQPAGNHNAGDLNFGPDGMLYVPTGDGGGAFDVDNHSQTTDDPLGKMLRLDINTDEPYEVPADNPFLNDPNTLDEIWAIGLRNPWRFSFDRETGDMYIADVGQGKLEEINFQPANSLGGENYGWNCLEGTTNARPDNCDGDDVLTAPVFEYAHDDGNCGGSVTGGYVYRGQQYPFLTGKYIYADYCTGFMWALERVDGDSWVNTEIHSSGSQWTTFGEDNNGELYAANRSGEIFQITVANTTNVDTAKDLVAIQVSNNPFDESLQLTVKTQRSGFAEFRLIDNNGRTLRQSKVQVYRDTNFEVETENLPSGIYFAEIRFAGQRVLEKVVKK